MHAIDYALAALIAVAFVLAFKKGFLDKGRCGGCSCGCGVAKRKEGCSKGKGTE